VKLRIAQISPVAMPVRPGEGDSIEQLVWLLTEELVRRGHAVTLFATGDSVTSAELHSVYPRGYEHDEDLWDWRHAETLNAAAAFERAREFDLIHSHAYHFALPFTRLVAIPTVHTCHTEVDPDLREGFARYREAQVVAISGFQARQLTGLERVCVIHNGIATEAFPFREAAGDYLLYLGRMIPDKGPAEAVEVARAAGMPVVLAGPPSDYFREAVEPLVDGSGVRYVGAVDHATRDRLLSEAAALVHPVTYPEPFGLVMVEAMSCGTPVAATPLGAVPEIVEPGVTGELAESPAELAERIPAVLALDRRRVREEAVRRFDYRRMADEHERLYRQLVGASP
jgi:glycosyltransferase involved in cell wall biosynthesis